MFLGIYTKKRIYFKTILTTFTGLIYAIKFKDLGQHPDLEVTDFCRTANAILSKSIAFVLKINGNTH